MGILLEEIEVRLAYFVFYIVQGSRTLFIDLDFNTSCYWIQLGGRVGWELSYHTLKTNELKMMEPI